MMKTTPRKMRSIALLTGAAVMSLTLIQPAPAQAGGKDKEKLYKGGAAALGVLGAYWILDGKTIPGAAAAAGAYYAYKKGQDVDNDDRYYRDDRYGDRYDNRSRDQRNKRDKRDRNRRDNSPNYRYDDYGSDYRNDEYRNDDYRNSDNRSRQQRDGYWNSNGRYPVPYGYSAAAPSGKNDSRSGVILR